MSSYKIVNYKTFDLKTLKYANPEKTRGGAFFIKVDTDYELLFSPKEPFVLNTGLKLTEKGTHININLKDTEFGAFIRSLDEYNIDCIHQNCKKWFGNDLPLHVIKQFYVSNMDENYNLKLQIPMSKKTIDIMIFDEKKNIIDNTNLIEGIQTIIVVRYLGIKFLKHEAVMDLDAVQIMIHKPKTVEVIPPQSTTQVDETIFKRMQHKELLIDKTEQVRIAFQEAERAQLIYQELQKKAMELSRELHEIQAEYDADGCDDNYGDDDEDADEDEEDAEDTEEEDAEDAEDAEDEEDEEDAEDTEDDATKEQVNTHTEIDLTASMDKP
jgi:hypothetical protein